MIVLFFFSSRRRHTRWNCDWSSDVCSSDLDLPDDDRLAERRRGARRHDAQVDGVLVLQVRISRGVVQIRTVGSGPDLRAVQIGRASCRESVDLGGRRIIIKKKMMKRYV